MNLAGMWKKLDMTADWQVRCPRCGRACRSLRLLLVEPRESHAAD